MSIILNLSLPFFFFFCLFRSRSPAVAEVDANTYWRNPFNSLCNPKQLEEFIVMEMDVVRDQKLGAGAGLRSNKVGGGGARRTMSHRGR